MKFSFINRRVLLHLQMILAVMFLGLSVQLLALYVDDVRAMRDVGLPAALSLPDIQRRMGILKEQSDVAQLQASVVGGSSEEMLDMYVLPDESELDRLLATVDLLTTELQKQGQLSGLTPVNIGESADVSVNSAHNSSAHFTKIPVNFEADVNEEGLKTLLLFQDLAGLLTISDALTKEEQSTLLNLTEQENPAAVTALETFLSTDLLSYVNNPKLAEEQLLKSFNSDTFEQSLHAIMKESPLHDVQALLLSSFGKALQTQKLWPLRFIIPTKTSLADKGDGLFHVAFMWEAYHRAR